MSNAQKFWFATAAAALLAVGFVAGRQFSKGEHRADAPLHEHDLQPVTNKQGGIEYWTCTMHPSVKMNGPGKCPICAMDLVPVKTGGSLAEGTPENESTLSGKSMFTVDPTRQQLIGVKTEEVTTRKLDTTISTVGTIALDETRVADVYPKFSGWISKVFVNYTWQHVEKGDPLFSVYSPELVSTQEEYLLALQAQTSLGQHPIREVASGAKSLLSAARRRLLLWDIAESQIDELAKTGEVRKDVMIYSPVTGHVTYRNAFENMRVEPGTRIYTVVDHSRIWVHVEVYEDDIPLVRLGQRATMSVPSFPGRQFVGRVAFIWPHLSESTRTLKVRLEFRNPGLQLKPGMYAHVKLQIPGRTVMALPESAVLRTGERDLVFVDYGDGRMEVRRVELGRPSDGFYEVTRGLELGEKIVVAGNFLIDAESQVQGAIANWGGNQP